MNRLTALCFLLALACSCTLVDKILHDDDVVASVGDQKLYLQQLQDYIPDGTSPEDSIVMARRFIDAWAKDVLYTRMASAQLSKEELDVSQELEQYRRSLLKYRYEQRYVADRLDTVVTHDQIHEYYNTHQKLFELEYPVLKVRFIEISRTAPKYDALLKALKSSGSKDLVLVDSLARHYASRYQDWTEEWIDAVELSKEFEMDYVSMLSQLSGNIIKVELEGSDVVRLARVYDIVRKGVAPEEFCETRIIDILLSARKRQLLESLEQDLLTDALSRKQLEIYSR